MKAAIALMIVVALAGCGEPKAQVDDVVVISGDTETTTPTATRATTGVGHIAGFIVDDAIRPIEGATVTLASLDLVDITDREGGFEFVDLKPGSYLLKFNASGHEDAESYIDVKDDRFTRVKVIMKAFGPPEPYIEVLSFNGFAELTSGPFWAIYWDSYRVVTEPGISGMVVEMTMAESDLGENGFDASLRAAGCCTTYHSMSMPNPLWVSVPIEKVHTSELRLLAAPWSTPVPEANKAFEVFVSLFYNQEVPDDYGLVPP